MTDMARIAGKSSGGKSKREAVEWEHHFRMKEAAFQTRRYG